MKKAVIVIAVVAGYCLLEIFLLLSLPVIGREDPKSFIYQGIAFLSQLVLIPALRTFLGLTLPVWPSCWIVVSSGFGNRGTDTDVLRGMGIA